MSLIEKHAFGIQVLQFVNMSPVFKGGAAIAIGISALLFALWMRKRKNEPLSLWFKFFIVLSIFIILYGSYILITKPDWWKLPY